MFDLCTLASIFTFKQIELINLRDYKDWDRTNGTLSVSLNPKLSSADSKQYVVLNGSMGNFCLDYLGNDEDKDLSRVRAWSSDTGYYVKINADDKVIVTRWWDNFEEQLPYNLIQQNPKKFYDALIKNNTGQTDSIVAFAKGAFIKLRNCIAQSNNGETSLRTFMYLLAALEEGVDKGGDIDAEKWKLNPFDSNIISTYDWEWLYEAFGKGTNGNKPNIKLLLRHASNKLFQEAHREATRKDFQLALWGGASRKYDEGISDGAFYTPTPLVRTIVQEALWSLDKAKPLSERSTISILDPACGSSEFLREALRQLKIRDYSGKVTVTGWDISKTACEISNFVLYYENRNEWNNEVDIKIEDGDSLTREWSQNAYDLVLMNPPFLAFEHLDKRKTIVQELLGNLKTRQPDLASVFLKKASEATAENGVLGLVLPHSLIGAETYSDLRKYIVNEMGIDFSLIARLGSAGLFEKAMIIPSVLVGTKKTKAKANTILWTDHQQSSVYSALRELRIYRSEDIPTTVNKDGFSIYENELFSSNFNSWNIKSYNTYQLSETLKRLTTVGDLFEIKQGVISGNNAAFLLTKEEFLSLPKKEQHYFRPAIMRDSIKNGQLNDGYFLFYPYDEFRVVDELELFKKLPVYCSKKLSEGTIEKLKKRRGRSELWWELNEHRPWQIDNSPKLISAYFGRAGYFAVDEKGDYLVGQSFAWIPKTTDLNNEDIRFAYLALLHAPLINKLLEMVCNVLEGGYFDLSKHYVDNMPLPDLSKIKEMDIFLSLKELGMNIHNGKPVDMDSLNQLAANAYGINIEEFI